MPSPCSDTVSMPIKKAKISHCCPAGRGAPSPSLPLSFSPYLSRDTHHLIVQVRLLRLKLIIWYLRGNRRAHRETPPPCQRRSHDDSLEERSSDCLWIYRDSDSADQADIVSRTHLASDSDSDPPHLRLDSAAARGSRGRLGREKIRRPGPAPPL